MSSALYHDYQPGFATGYRTAFARSYSCIAIIDVTLRLNILVLEKLKDHVEGLRSNRVQEQVVARLNHQSALVSTKC